MRAFCNDSAYRRITNGERGPGEASATHNHEGEEMTSELKNVLGGELQVCCMSPRTGWTRSGKCETGPRDHGRHVVCAEMTERFLAFTRAKGNDLSTPVPQYGFPGLAPGDRWCLCASRWLEAVEADMAPPIVLQATHIKALETVSLEVLKAHALDLQ